MNKNEKKFLEEKDNNKNYTKETKCSNTIARTNIFTLPEQDQVSRLPADTHQNSISINIYDTPPVDSISQWAHNELLKYMKI